MVHQEGAMMDHIRQGKSHSAKATGHESKKRMCD